VDAAPAAVLQKPARRTRRHPRTEPWRAGVRRRRPLALVDRIRIAELDAGVCVQALHVGPYSTESATIDEMRAFMRAHDPEARGLHHEIYPGDPRRAAPERLKTILRQPVG
jgi:hypothetical protein